jgi:hypothetical protein
MSLTGFYQVTQAIKDQLELDPIVTTVTYGDIFDIDLNKKTLFPLSHLVVNNATMENNIWRFNLSVFAIDIMDISKSDNVSAFIGNDNEQDILHTQLAVLNKLFEVLRRGNLHKDLYQLDGSPSCEPFTERFENNLAGWVGTFEVLVPNQMSGCDIPIVRPTCAPATYEIVDSLLNSLYTGSITSGESSTITISDSTVTIKDDSNNTLHTVSVTAEGTANQVISDSTVANSDSSYTASINAEGSLVLPSSQVNVNSVNEGNIVSVKTVSINITDSNGVVTPQDVTITGNTVAIQVPAPTSRSTATLLKTGQSVSYRTGDDGDIEAGRAANFTTLAENNPFGNTNRFTDELGGQTYTNDIVIDWSTYNGTNVLGYRRTLSGSAVIWNDAIDGAAAVSIGSFTTGWRLPNLNELSNLTAFGIANPFNYSPINIATGNQLWSSTTIHAFTNQAYYCDTFIGAILNNIKGTTYKYIACRTFTVTGTTLS